MQTINCYIPLKLRLNGEPSEDDWVALEEVLVAKYSSALKRSVAELTKSQLIRAEMPEDVREPFAPERVGLEGYWIPGYQEGKPTQIPLRYRRATTITRQTLLQLIKQREQIRKQIAARQAHAQTKLGERSTSSSEQETFLIVKQLRLLDKQIDLLARKAGVASLADAWTLLRQLHTQFTASKEALDLVRHINELGEQLRPEVQLPLHKMSGDIDMPDPAEEVQSETQVLERSFLDTFQKLARDVALFVLEQSKTEARAEEARYTTHTFEEKTRADIKDLRQHAQELASLEQEITSLERLSILSGATEESFLLPQEREHRLRLEEELENKKRLFEEKKCASSHPILLARGVDYSKLAAAEMGRAQILHIHELVASVISDIDKTRKELEKENGVLIWSLAPIIEITKEIMEIVPGSHAERLIDDEFYRRRRADEEIDRILGVLGFALGIIGMFLTSGALVIVGAAISTTIAVRDIQQYRIKRAISHTALDPAAALSQEDPSLAMVALSVAGAIVDVVAALGTFRNMVRAFRGAKTLKDVEKAARNTVEELAKANNLKTHVNKEALAKELENEARSLKEVEQLPEQITKETRAAKASGGGGPVGRQTSTEPLTKEVRNPEPGYYWARGKKGRPVYKNKPGNAGPQRYYDEASKTYKDKPQPVNVGRIPQEAGRLQEKVFSDITGWPKNNKSHPTSFGDRIPDYLVKKDFVTGKWITAATPEEAMFVADSKYYNQTTIELDEQIKGFIELAGKTKPPSGRHMLLLMTNKDAKIAEEILEYGKNNHVTVRQIVQTRSR